MDQESRSILALSSVALKMARGTKARGTTPQNQGEVTHHLVRTNESQLRIEQKP
jgi:hypothetical protein